MTAHNRFPFGLQVAHLRRAALLVLMVAGTLLYVWRKVEQASIARQIDAQQVRSEELQDENARLTAAVVFKKKPGAIERIARGQLGMEYPAGPFTELSFDPTEMGEVE
jgi:cell division protein FtsL